MCKRILIIFSFLLGISTLLYSEPAIKAVQSEQMKYISFMTNTDFEINNPLILEDAIVFVYKGKANTVLVTGDFDGWKGDLLLDRRTNDIYMYSWEKRLTNGIYLYKFIVDGVWMADPFNTNYIIDASGQKVSYLKLKEDFIPNKKYPLWLEGNYYVFRYYNENVKQVSLVGEFNHWNPYSHVMNYIGAGWFEIKIQLKPGHHVYCFVADGEWIPDPGNLVQFSDQTGHIVNVLKTPGSLNPYDYH